MNDAVVIQECMKEFPLAVSEVEAVDLAAIQTLELLKAKNPDMSDTEYKLLVNKYQYLNSLRSHLHKSRIQQMSGFVRSN